MTWRARWRCDADAFELRDGAADFSAAVFDDEAVFAVLRYLGRAACLSSSTSPRGSKRGGARCAGGGEPRVPNQTGPCAVQLGPYGLALLDVRR